jgi:hypothetical protein
VSALRSIVAGLCALAPALAAASLVTIGAQAQSFNPAVREFLTHCQFDRGWCQNRIEAARMVVVVQGACVPEQLTPDRVTTAVIDWLKRNPVPPNDNEESGGILITAMKGEWPCGR